MSSSICTWSFGGAAGSSDMERERTSCCAVVAVVEQRSNAKTVRGVATRLARARTRGDRTSSRCVSFSALTPRFSVEQISFYDGIKHAHGFVQPDAASNVPRNKRHGRLVLKTKSNPTRDEAVQRFDSVDD